MGINMKTILRSIGVSVALLIVVSLSGCVLHKSLFYNKPEHDWARTIPKGTQTSTVNFYVNASGLDGTVFMVKKGNLCYGDRGRSKLVDELVDARDYESHLVTSYFSLADSKGIDNIKSVKVPANENLTLVAWATEVRGRRSSSCSAVINWDSGANKEYYAGYEWDESKCYFALFEKKGMTMEKVKNSSLYNISTNSCIRKINY